MMVSYRSLLALVVMSALTACAGGSDESAGAPPADNSAEEVVSVDPMEPLAMLDPEPVHGPVEELPISPTTPIALNGSAAAADAPTTEVQVTAAAEPAPSAPAAAPAATSGVFTAAQANRGQQVQQKECAGCHNPADWGQGRVLGNFAGASALDLLEYIRMTMPMDSPGRLSLQEYTDIVAYLFHLNGLPAGSSELPADEDRLRAIQVDYRR